MAEEFQDDVVEEQQVNPGADVEMGEGDEAEGSSARNGGGDLPFAEGGDTEPRTSFISYLTSPVVTLLVGIGDSETILTAHQGLLAQSPFFSDVCAAFTDDGSVGPARFFSISDILIPFFIVAATDRASQRRVRPRRLLPRVPVHRRLFPSKAGWPATLGARPFDTCG